MKGSGLLDQLWDQCRRDYEIDGDNIFRKEEGVPFFVDVLWTLRISPRNSLYSIDKSSQDNTTDGVSASVLLDEALTRVNKSFRTDQDDRRTSFSSPALFSRLWGGQYEIKWVCVWLGQKSGIEY